MPCQTRKGATAAEAHARRHSCSKEQETEAIMHTGSPTLFCMDATEDWKNIAWSDGSRFM